MESGSPSALRASAAGIACPFKEGHLKAVLARLLAPGYVKLAFNMPEACTTIWNLISEDMETIGRKNEEDFLLFLSIFFADPMVRTVAANMKELEVSYLGPDYALKRGPIVLAQILLEDIRDAYVAKPGGALFNFLGSQGEIPENQFDSGDGVEDHGGEWTIVKGRKDRKGQSGQSGGGSSSNGRGGGRIGGGRGGGRSGSGGPPSRGQSLVRAAPFRSCTVVLVAMSQFDTPDKGTNHKQRIDRDNTLKERSLEFITSKSIQEPEKMLYNPEDETKKFVRLYHGTRTSSLERFRHKGIEPREKPNEFSAKAAFYVSNSLRQAFEHPLHVHVGVEKHMDPPSVLVFQVDSEILHGNKAPLVGSDNFKVYWFRDSEYDAWLKFCIKNLKLELEAHDYDIVIGPTCISQSTKKLEGGLPGGINLTQIACCTQRAMDWMGGSIVQIYTADRMYPS